MDEKLYTQSLRFLTRRPRSEKEIRDYLAKKKAPLEQIEIIVDLLKKQKFLDDMEFAKWWVEQRTRFRVKGWHAIAFELKQKGISKDVLENLETSIENSEFENRNEKELARELTQKRIKKYQGLSKQEIYQKLGGFLARRGFDIDVIKACIDEVLGK